MMTSDPRDLHSVEQHPDYAASVPTPDHFLPIAYLAGLCSAGGEVATVFVEGGTLGSITRTSYVVGAPPQPAPASAASGQGMPNPATVPPEQTNL
jgi:4,5-DOPA dioxygenase extradiol